MTKNMTKIQNKMHKAIRNNDTKLAADYGVMLAKELRKEFINLMNGGSSVTLPILIACLDEFYAKFKEGLPVKVLEDAKDLWKRLTEGDTDG